MSTAEARRTICERHGLIGKVGTPEVSYEFPMGIFSPKRDWVLDFLLCRTTTKSMNMSTSTMTTSTVARMMLVPPSSFVPLSDASAVVFEVGAVVAFVSCADVSSWRTGVVALGVPAGSLVAIWDIVGLLPATEMVPGQTSPLLQSTQVWMAMAVLADLRSPGPHVSPADWARHESLRWLADGWYASTPHGVHVRSVIFVAD